MFDIVYWMSYYGYIAKGSLASSGIRTKYYNMKYITQKVTWESAVTIYLDVFKRHLKKNAPQELIEGNCKELLKLARSYDLALEHIDNLNKKNK